MLVREAVGSDCGESAGHVEAFLAMPLLPLRGEGDLLVPLLLCVFDLLLELEFLFSAEVLLFTSFF